jgi:hypothetical protein
MPPKVWISGSPKVLVEAPLSSWIQEDIDQSFAGEMECESWRADALATAARAPHYPGYPDLDSDTEQLLQVRCISESDWLKSRK